MLVHVSHHPHTPPHTPTHTPTHTQANLSRPRGPANRRRPSHSPRPSLETNQSDSSPVLKDELPLVWPSERSKVTEGWHDDVDSGELSVQEMTARLNGTVDCSGLAFISKHWKISYF